MPDDVKDFIILCINDKRETVKLRIKNMLDFNEREEIAFLEKKTRQLMHVFYTLLIAMGCSLVICCFWTLMNKDSWFVYVCWIVLLLGFIACCVFKEYLEKIFRKYFIKRRRCDFLCQYLKGYSDADWICLKDTVEKAHDILALLHIRTPEGNLLYTDPHNYAASITITYGKTSFKLDCVSYTENGDQIQTHKLFNTENFIKNCKLEKDTVEYDFLKNELRVPLEFEI